MHCPRLAVLPVLALAGCAGSTLPDETMSAVLSQEPATREGLEGLRLEVLSATSGTGVERIIDRDPATSWTPVPDPSEEGVLLRFEVPLAISAVRVEGCPIGNTSVQLFADAATLGRQPLDQGSAEFSFSPPLAPRSLYLRMTGKVGMCLSELHVISADGAELALLPPRKVTGTITATSVLVPEAAYRPAYLFDGRAHFAWAEGAQGDGEGQRLDIQFDLPQEIAALEIWNGYQRSDDHFEKNSRASKIRVSSEEGTAQELAVLDQAGAQKLALSPPLRGRRLSIEILESEDGTRYDDLVISELRFYDAQGPFGLLTQDLALAEASLRTELRGTPLESVVGRIFHSRCEPELGTLKLRRDSSFVWYGRTGPVKGGKGKTAPGEEVFDGAWAIERKEGPWAKIGLYGRRQKVEAVWQPYSEERTVDTTQVSGGTLEIALARELGPRLADELKELGRAPSQERIGCVDEDELRDLMTSNALLVKGTALTDLLVPVR